MSAQSVSLCPRDTAARAATTLDDILAAAKRAGALHVDILPEGVARIVLPLLTLAAMNAGMQGPYETSCSSTAPTAQHQPAGGASSVAGSSAQCGGRAAAQGSTAGAGDVPLPPGLAAGKAWHGQYEASYVSQRPSTAALRSSDAARKSEDPPQRRQRSKTQQAHSARRAAAWQARAQGTRVPPPAVGVRSGADKHAGDHIELNMSAIDAAADCYASALAAYEAAAMAAPVPADADAVMLPATVEAPEEWYEGAAGAAALASLCGAKRQRDEAGESDVAAVADAVVTAAAAPPASYARSARRALEPSFRTPPSSPPRSPRMTPDKTEGWTVLGSPKRDSAGAAGGGGGGRGGAVRLHLATLAVVGCLVQPAAPYVVSTAALSVTSGFASQPVSMFQPQWPAPPPPQRPAACGLLFDGNLSVHPSATRFGTLEDVQTAPREAWRGPWGWAGLATVVGVAAALGGAIWCWPRWVRGDAVYRRFVLCALRCALCYAPIHSISALRHVYALQRIQAGCRGWHARRFYRRLRQHVYTRLVWRAAAVTMQADARRMLARRLVGWIRRANRAVHCIQVCARHMLTRLHRRRGRNWRRAARRRQAKAAAAHARPPGRGAAVQSLLDDGERLVHAGERLAYLDALRWLDVRGYLTAEHMRAAVRIQAAVRGRQVRRAGWADAGIDEYTDALIWHFGACGGGGAWDGYRLCDDDGDADGDYDYDYDTYADGIDDYLTDGGTGGWEPGGVEVE